MAWRVKGVDRKTGKDVEVVVEADDEAGAARASQLVVERVTKMPDDGVPNPKQQLRGPAPAPADTFTHIWENPPPYVMVKVAGSVVSAAGWISVVVGVIMILISFSPPSARGDAPAVSIIAGASFLIAGVLQVGFGSLILMMRDVAIHILKVK